MASGKFFGAIGFSEGTVELRPGYWDDVVVEKQYYGDVTRLSKAQQAGEKINSDLTINASIAILADPYFDEHSYAIRYVAWKGARWHVTEITPEGSRLLLRLGGVYNGPTPEASGAS